MNNVSLVIFDMDGLLVNSERGMWLVNEKRAIEELGYKFDEKLITSLMGASVAIYKKTIVDFYGPDFPIDKYYQMVFDYNTIMIDNKELTLMKRAKEFLDFLKEQNIPMCIATSTEKNNAYKILNSLNLTNYFDYIVTGDEVENGKPSPDIYLKALRNTDKEKALIFEDGHNGARAAIASGVRLVLVPDIAYLSDQDKKEAFEVINNLNEAIPLIKKLNNIK